MINNKRVIRSDNGYEEVIVLHDGTAWIEQTTLTWLLDDLTIAILRGQIERLPADSKGSKRVYFDRGTRAAIAALHRRINKLCDDARADYLGAPIEDE